MKKQQNQITNFVISQDEHLQNISQIITRDFYPELGKLKNQTVEASPSMNLNNYLVNFRSDENQTFSQIIENNKQEWKQRFWWVNKEQRQKHKQGILMASQSSMTKMIQAQRKHKLAINAPPNQNGKSDFFFPMESNIVDKQMEKYDKQKKIAYQNTRLDQMIKPLQYAIQKKNSDYNLDTKLVSTPLLHGIYDQDIKKRQKYQLDQDGFKVPSKKRVVQTVNGYKLVTMPSPSPNTMQSPLMTYGQIQDTPLRLPEYQIPSTPKRDIILEQLNNKIIKTKKEQKQKKQSTVLRILGSSTPNSLHSFSKRKDSSLIRKDSSIVRKKQQNLQGLLNL